jgi:hypothetical protein
MMNRNRREFLADIGKGMLVASVGPALVAELGLMPAFAGDTSERLTFGSMEPLVSLIQDTPPEKLLPILVDKVKNGTELKTLVAATALANARTFGGHNYNGYHAFMALAPSYHMSKELPSEKAAIPVLKVIHRNSRFIQGEGGGHDHEALKPVTPLDTHEGHAAAEALRDLMRKDDRANAEKLLAARAEKSLEEAYNELLMCVQDEVDVHRVVLAWRAWATLELTGKDVATTLLRQSIHFCCDSEHDRITKKRGEGGVRKVLPELLDKYRLLSKSPGTRKADDEQIEKLCHAIYAEGREKAAEVVAAALADGFAPEDVGEAIALAANRLVLRDPGLAKEQPGKPLGSVHGASVGVHASDAANAWRNIARVANRRNAVASLIVAGYHTAGQAGYAGKPPYPQPEHLAAVKGKDEKSLLAEAEDAIKSRNQPQACATIARYGESGFAPRAAFDLMLKYACSEDGALHAEKYYRTVSEEFAITRPAFKWRQLVALARVTASECGFPAPGYAEACQLLKV